MKTRPVHFWQIVALIASFAFGLPMSAQWSRTSGPEGGAAAALLSTPQFMLVGMESGGVYRSTNGGGTWQYASTGLPGEGPGGYSFVALGSTVFVANGIGISKSVDGGLTWISANGGLPASGLPGVSLAVRGNIVFLGAYGGGVYRSLDSGGTWTKNSIGLTDTNVAALCAGSAYLYAGTDEGGVFRSSNDGVSWQPVSSGLAPGDGLRILDFAADSGALIVGTRGGAYRSTNNGDTWVLAASGLTSRAVSALMASGTDFLAGTYGFGVFRSTNAGVDWFSSSTGWASGNVRTFCTNGGVLFGGNYGAPVIYKSTDNGSTWSPSGSGITSRLVYGVATLGVRVFAATSDGVASTSDNGSTWVESPAPLGNRSVYSIAPKGGILFAGTSGNGPYRSTDNGATWVMANGNLPSGSSQSILSLASDATYMYAGTYAGVYRSTDNGTSWAAAKNGMTDSVTLSLCTANGRIFAGTPTGLYGSTNSGSSWMPVTNGLPSYRVISIVCVDSIFLAAFGFGGNPTVYRSIDNGASWTPTSSGLATYSTTLQTLLVVGKNIFGGTSANGVWVSTDKGLNWSDISTGMSGPGLRVAALASAGGYLFSAANRGGVWKRPLSEVVASIGDRRSGEVVQEFKLDQNYPNPFNPTTVIRYQVPGAGRVKLVAYDLLGREVAVLVNEKKDPGAYEVTFHADGLGSGIYFYRLDFGGFASARKMVLMK